MTNASKNLPNQQKIQEKIRRNLLAKFQREEQRQK